LATSVVSLLKNVSLEVQDPGRETHQRGKQEHRSALYHVTILTLLAFLVHGYHPFAEDGGLYLAGIKRVLEPGMFPHEAGFVLGHLRFSIFAPSVAAVVRLSGMRLETVLLLMYLASIWATLWAGWLVAARSFHGKARLGAVALLATWLTLPVAGTSLMLMDPYVTARSFSTPCIIAALAYALEFLVQWQQSGQYERGSLIKITLMMILAWSMHPLMAAYGFGCILALGIVIIGRQKWLIAMSGLSAFAVTAGAILRYVAQPESSGYRQVAMSRYYWFLSQWQWYEWLGLIAPMAILSFIASVTQKNKNSFAFVSLARACVAAGTAALVVALIFARPNTTNLLVARLQPLRVFQTIYIVMILFVGAQLATWLGSRKVRWTATFAVLASIMFFAERKTFPASPHIELSSERQGNAWVQAFEWIRSNTPRDALFALDADYITKPGEDAQSFRAIAERSALPDYSKDGGEAAITPSLTEDWRLGQALQTRLSERSDRERLVSLRPAGVTWVVLARGAVTSFRCDYANTAVKVCHLPTGNSLSSSSYLNASR
jgi:hypothetical protein